MPSLLTPSPRPSERESFSRMPYSRLIFLFPEMNVMRLVLLNQFFRDEAFGGAPDEIHFGV
jgi:hypothetical protein